MVQIAFDEVMLKDKEQKQKLAIQSVAGRKKKQSRESRTKHTKRCMKTITGLRSKKAKTRYASDND